MTLASLVVKNTLRNKMRSALTLLSVGFSFFLLTLLAAIWRGFYIEPGPAEAAMRLITRHRVSLVFPLPAYYREEIRKIRGVLNVVPMTWVGGRYIDDTPQNIFAQFATDPQEAFRVHREWRVQPDELQSWRRDRAGAAVERVIAERHGWQIGDRIVLGRNIYPVDLELTVRAVFDAGTTWQAVLFHTEYLEESVPSAKGRAGTFSVLVDSAQAASRMAQQIDRIFRNAPVPTKTESEKAFLMNFVAMLGNVKLFILGISLAVTFAILLVSANTMAMSIRERIREVAVLRTLGFPRGSVLALFISEAVLLSSVGAALGAFGAIGAVNGLRTGATAALFSSVTVTPATVCLALVTSWLVAVPSVTLPAYHAVTVDLARGLRHSG